MGGQLRIEQIGHMQIEQRLCTQVLQGLLHLLQPFLQDRPFDGQPDKALFRRP
jgi:hypothetical protein